SERAILGEFGNPQAQTATLLQLIVLPTTQYTLQRRTTHRPVNLSVWRFLIQTCKIGQYVKCRVAAAHHQDAFPCITRAMTASHIRHAIEDVIPDSAF